MKDMLTTKQAYFAMYKYLEHLYEMTNSDDLAGFLGSMSTLQDGMPADPAIWEDWLEAIAEVLKGNIESDLRIYKDK